MTTQTISAQKVSSKDVGGLLAKPLRGLGVCIASMVHKKMAMVVPAGTEITRQGVSDAGKKGCVMVVKPVARAYILSGHMMSSWVVGDWLLRKKWPAISSMFLALALHTADYLGAFYTLTEVPGVNDAAVPINVPTLASSTMSFVSMLAFSISMVCVLTRVHSQLLWMTLRTFDPWATRSWDAHFYANSRCN